MRVIEHVAATSKTRSSRLSSFRHLSNAPFVVPLLLSWRETAVPLLDGFDVLSTLRGKQNLQQESKDGGVTSEKRIAAPPANYGFGMGVANGFGMR